MKSDNTNGNASTSTSSLSKDSVCRQFYKKISRGGDRQPQELVKFLMNHPSSCGKIKDWIRSEEGGMCSLETPHESTHDDYNIDRSTPGQKREGEGEDRASVVSLEKNYDKCNESSVKNREKGNAFFKHRKLLESLQYYNEAIKFACFPKLQEEENKLELESVDSTLAMAFANRSAVYDELGSAFYENALRDIDYALKYGYPAKLKPKLFTRKASIYANQGNAKLAKECLEIIKVAGAISPAIETKISEIEIQISQLQNNPNTNAESEATSKEVIKHEVDILSSFSENSNFANASSQIELCVSDSTSPNDNFGRYVVASNDLNEGDTLFLEEPFASILLPEFYTSHCYHCHKTLCDASPVPHFFPCKGCVQVIFCSNLCFEAAETYHVHECKWLSLLQSVGVAHLAIRIALVAGTTNILNCTKDNSHLTDITNLNIFKKESNHYERVYSLLDHIDDMYEEDLFQYTLVASLLTTFLLTKTSFLTNVSEEECFQIGGAMLRHICQLVCNAHAITDVLPDDNPVNSKAIVVDEYQKRIATAIYPSASMMNHSCDPNILFQFSEGKKLVVKAARVIKKSENVFNCYGPHFRRMPLTERQEILMQQYFFKCTCVICKKEMASGSSSFANQFQAFKCDACEEPILEATTPDLFCRNCGEAQNMKPKIIALNLLNDIMRKGEFLLDHGRNLEETIDTFKDCYHSATEILYKHHSQLGQICDSLARCYISAGKPNDAAVYAKQSLNYVGERFGKSSLEYNREIIKYQNCAVDVSD